MRFRRRSILANMYISVRLAAKPIDFSILVLYKILYIHASTGGNWERWIWFERILYINRYNTIHTCFPLFRKIDYCIRRVCFCILNIMFKKTCFHYYVCGIPITNEIHHQIIYINSNTICVNHVYHCFNTLQFEVTIATRVLLAIFTQEEFFFFLFSFGD